MADLQWSLDVNYLGVARVTKAVLPLMRRQRSGRLIAVTSLGGVVGQPFNESYCAAKFATEGMYESLHPVLAEFGIHVSIVEPGLVATPFVDKIVGTSGWQADDRPPDDEYAPLLAAYLAHMASPSVVGQPAEAVASLLVEIATSDEPVLRYQSSPAATAVARLKLADLDGQRVSTLTRGWLQA